MSFLGCGLSEQTQSTRIRCLPSSHVKSFSDSQRLTSANGKLEGQTPRKAYFTRVCDSRRRQRSGHNCQQLGDLLRVAGGVGSDAKAEAVDGRAEAVPLDVLLRAWEYTAIFQKQTFRILRHHL